MRYVHQDHLGSTAVVTDSAGKVVFERTYDPWGNFRTSTGTATTDRLFTGQRFDAATGQYYYNARYYDPTLGRFISPDTIVPGVGDPQAWNRYAYVVNNPLRFVDPSGNSHNDGAIANLESVWEGALDRGDFRTASRIQRNISSLYADSNHAPGITLSDVRDVLVGGLEGAVVLGATAAVVGATLGGRRWMRCRARHRSGRDCDLPCRYRCRRRHLGRDRDSDWLRPWS